MWRVTSSWLRTPMMQQWCLVRVWLWLWKLVEIHFSDLHTHNCCFDLTAHEDWDKQQAAPAEQPLERQPPRHTAHRVQSSPTAPLSSMATYPSPSFQNWPENLFTQKGADMRATSLFQYFYTLLTSSTLRSLAELCITNKMYVIIICCPFCHKDMLHLNDINRYLMFLLCLICTSL